MKRALPMLAATALLGCSGATTSFTRTGPTVPAQADGCDFAVVTSRPSEPHTELGTIDLKYTSQTDWIYEESAFKRKVRPLVCQSGGDTVIGHTNENSLYTKATVLTTKPIPSAAPAAEPAPETASQAVDSVSTPESAPLAESPPPAREAAEAPKEETASKEAAPSGKKGGKKGASAKKEEDIRGKDGKIDIDKLL